MNDVLLLLKNALQYNKNKNKLMIAQCGNTVFRGRTDAFYKNTMPLMKLMKNHKGNC